MKVINVSVFLVMLTSGTVAYSENSGMCSPQALPEIDCCIPSLSTELTVTDVPCEMVVDKGYPKAHCGTDGCRNNQRYYNIINEHYDLTLKVDTKKYTFTPEEGYEGDCPTEIWVFENHVITDAVLVQEVPDGGECRDEHCDADDYPPIIV